jgi:acetoin utilization deacetylase AcuC-like enzyme
VLYFSHPSSLEHDPSAQLPGHPDTPERLRVLETVLGHEDWLGWERREAPKASEEDLELVHSTEHVTAIRELAASGGGAIDLDTYVGESSFEAALYAAGGARAMTEALMAGEARAGLCALRPSGHHAERGRAMGFCLFNNVAVAAEAAIRRLGAERVLILDWDVHHGNGTEEIFSGRDDVLFVSIHQEGIYPGTGPLEEAGDGPGEGYTVNLPVPAGSDEEIWVSLVEHIVVPVGLQFQPQLVLVSAGFDAHVADPLAGCNLESGSFALMASHVRELGRRLGAPVGAVLEGGYDPASMAESVSETMAALAGEGNPASTAPEPLFTPRAAAQVSRYWEV